MIASRGQMLGQDDIINDRNYTTSARCMSGTGTLFIMQSQDFIKFIKRDRRSMRNFGEVSTERDALTQDKLRDAIKASKKYGLPADMLND